MKNMNIKKKLLFLTSTILSVFAFLTIISLFGAPSKFLFGENGLFSPAKVYAAETSNELSLTLLGEETIYYTLGTEYQELGAIAYDPIDGDISEEISITGSVDINSIGTYKITYKITHNEKTITKYRNVVISNLYDEYIYDYSSSKVYAIEANTRPSGTRYLTQASSTINPLEKLIDMATGTFNIDEVRDEIQNYYTVEIPVGTFNGEIPDKTFTSKDYVVHGPEKYQRITIRSKSKEDLIKRAKELTGMNIELPRE